jgi:hypothetical protein
MDNPANEKLRRIVAAAIRSFYSLRITRDGGMIMIRNETNRDLPPVIQFHNLFLEPSTLFTAAYDIYPEEYVYIDITNRTIVYK